RDAFQAALKKAAAVVANGIRDRRDDVIAYARKGAHGCTDGRDGLRIPRRSYPGDRLTRGCRRESLAAPAEFKTTHPRTAESVGLARIPATGMSTGGEARSRDLAEGPVGPAPALRQRPP